MTESVCACVCGGAGVNEERDGRNVLSQFNV